LLVLAESIAQPLLGESEAKQRSQSDEALHVLDRAFALGIQTQAYYSRRAQYLAQAGRSEEAERERKKAETLTPHGTLDYFLIGDEYYRKNDWKKANLAFESVLQAQPDHFWAQYYLALCALKAHRADQATARLTSCLAQRPDFPWLYLLRGSAWGELGQFARAEKDFEAALQAKLPDSARYGLFINRGVLRIRQGRLDRAIEDLRQAIALKPKLYQGYVNLAQAYLKGQQPEEARRQLDEAIRREPSLPALYRTRCRVHVLRQDTAAALADLDEAIRLESGDSRNLAGDQLERGRLLYRQKDYAGALAATDDAIRVNPRDPQVYRLRADTLLEMKKLPEALQALDACLKYGPDDVAVLRARAALRTRLGQYAGAQTDYTRILEREADAGTYAARGWNFVFADAPKLALDDFQQSIRLASDRAESYVGRGYAQVLLGKCQRGVADAEEALRHGPRSPRLCYNAARVYAQASSRIAAELARNPRAVAELREEWRNRAMQLLVQTFDMQKPGEAQRFWRDFVQSDVTLNPIRRMLGFGQLAARFALNEPSSSW
jgi:tetratricopeptide (TPR) repeat protein